jgi:STE24 endopeptidase
MSLLTAIFVLIVVTSAALRLWLGGRNVAQIRHHSDDVPEQLRGKLTLAAHRTAANYTIAKERLGQASAVLTAAIWLAWTVGGGINALEAALGRIGPTPVFGSIVVVVTMVALTALVRLPISVYAGLVVDRRFGFARAGVRLMVADLTKKALIGLIVLVPGAIAALWFIGTGRADWWIYVWLLWTGATLLKLWVYPAVVAPLFNRYAPLDDAVLVDRLEALAARSGFALDGVRVVDASRRTGHGNASFDGLGGTKRITLTDTLLETLVPAEIEAVMAHEIGHFRRRHVQLYLTAMAATRFLALGLLAWLAGTPGFHAALGVNAATPQTTLLLFGIVFAACRPLARPFEAALLRRFEFEADQFAARHSAPGALAEALIKLFRNNATSVTEDRLFSVFYQGHPPLAARLARIQDTPPANGTRAAAASS